MPDFNTADDLQDWLDAQEPEWLIEQAELHDQALASDRI